MPVQRAREWGFFTQLLCFALFGCSNGSGSVEEGDANAGGAQGGGDSSYTVSLEVSGLAGDGLVLQNNGGNDIPVAANGRLTFSQPLPSGSTYNVTVLSQPTDPAQDCTVLGGSGTIANDNVTDVSVACSTPNAQSFAIRGTVTGLLGRGLVLQNNEGDDLSVGADGAFSFSTPLPTGSDYSVTVLTQPLNPAQTCSVNNNAGTVGTQDVTNVLVTCSATSFAVGVGVSGLRGFGLQLRLNGTEVLSISGNGTYQFSQLVARGAPYSVSVLTQPTNPVQACVVGNSSGIINDANVTLPVTCSDLFTVGGTVTDLAGRGLVLQLNGGNNLAVTSSGPFQFGAALASGTQYSVSVQTQPSDPTQECRVENGSGAIGGANVSNIGVTCTTRTFKVRGTVTGLIGRGLRLRNVWGNQQEDLPIAANGSFAFPTDLLSGSNYTISVQQQPTQPRQVCSIANATGTVGGADVTDVQVSCAAPTEFDVGGSVANLAGQGLQLQNNGADTITLAAGQSSFTFPTPVKIGAPYNVTVLTHPASPTQTCTVNNGIGIVNDADIASVQVNCTTQSFTVGGAVSGLRRFNFGLQLQLNSGEVINVPFDQTFTFQAPVLSGSTYTVTVLRQPSGSTCNVVNGSGIMGGANVTDIAVRCD